MEKVFEVIKKKTGEVIGRYIAEVGDRSKFGGPWGEDDVEHIENVAGTQERENAKRADEEKQAARSAAIERIRSANVDGVTTVAALKVIVKDLIEVLK